MMANDQITGQTMKLEKIFDQTASFFSPPLSDSSPAEENVTSMLIISILTWGSDLLGDHRQVFLPLRQGLWVR